MKYAYCFLLLVSLWGCGKSKNTTPAPARTTMMSAQVNGQNWQIEGGLYPYAQIDASSAGAPHYNLNIRGGSSSDLTALGIKTITITLSANYLPKIGRHRINYGLINGRIDPLGPPNPASHYMSAGIQYELLDTSVYQAVATGGMVEITEVSDQYVGGTFEYTAHSPGVPSSSNAPSNFTIAQGRFYALLSANGKSAVWDGVQ